MNTYSYHLCNSATPHGKNNNQQLNKTRINKEKLTQNKLSFLLNNSTIKLRINKIFIIQPDPPVKFSFQKKKKQTKQTNKTGPEKLRSHTKRFHKRLYQLDELGGRTFEKLRRDYHRYCTERSVHHEWVLLWCYARLNQTPTPWQVLLSSE